MIGTFGLPITVDRGGAWRKALVAHVFAHKFKGPRQRTCRCVTCWLAPCTEKLLLAVVSPKQVGGLCV
jgi:hypothetical protein